MHMHTHTHTHTHTRAHIHTSHPECDAAGASNACMPTHCIAKGDVGNIINGMTAHDQ